MENNLIYENPHCLPRELCETIINFFEEEGDARYKGIVMSGVYEEIKNTLDFIIPNDGENKKWERINNVLIKSLKTNIDLYLKHINDKYEISICDSTKISIEPFLIQKYKKGVGKYEYHNDFQLRDTDYRILTFLWYLNNITEGGETEFFGDIKITPEDGKLIIFPANWTFPHCGKMPLSSDKYIVTGWVYIDLTETDKLINTINIMNKPTTVDSFTQTDKPWYYK